jgi:hypothetical protein
MPDTYVCPVCGRESHNPNDARERYCGACHAYTSEEPPPGMRWIRFEGGRNGAFGRMLRDGVEKDSEYIVIVEDERYQYDGAKFVLTEPVKGGS